MFEVFVVALQLGAIAWVKSMRGSASCQRKSKILVFYALVSGFMIFLKNASPIESGLMAIELSPSMPITFKSTKFGCSRNPRQTDKAHLLSSLYDHQSHS